MNYKTHELVSPKLHLKKTYVIGDGDSGLPYLISPVDIYNANLKFIFFIKGSHEKI